MSANVSDITKKESPIEYHADFFKVKPLAHQLVGIDALLKHKAFALFDEMGVGKSAQVINAACILAERGEIDTVVVVCPASVRSVWCDAEIGEIKKHSWLSSHVFEFHEKLKCIWSEEGNCIGSGDSWVGCLDWVITNYEWLRGGSHLLELIQRVRGTSKTLLVLDESSFIKSRTAKQTKAIMKLREHCARCVILNGTPVTQSPLDLWAQMNVVDKNILGQYFKSFWQFRFEYCETVPQRFGNVRFNKIVHYRRLDDLQKKIAPYCLRRLKADCLDLPPKLYTQREVELTPESWRMYQELKREAVISLGNGDLRLEPNAATRIMRLAQLTSGHLGGASILNDNGALEAYESPVNLSQDYSNEKLDWCVHYLTEECTASHVIVWCRWRRERERLNSALVKEFYDLFQVYGGQSATDRQRALEGFCSNGRESRRRILLAQSHAGGFGLNLQIASEEWFLSNDWSYGVRLQAEDRVHRSGQRNNVLIGDVLATGPAGQRTIDHTILAALRDKQSLAEMTTAAWRKELSDE
jgi:SNF2 family DNA or RNA helicase